MLPPYNFAKGLKMKAYIYLLCTFVFLTSIPAFATTASEKMQKTSEQSVRTDVGTQKKFVEWLKEEEKLISQIQSKEAELELLNWKNEKAKQYIKDLQVKVAELKIKKEQMEQISQQLLPLLDTTLKQTRQFIETDFPYAQAVRQKRLSMAEAVLGDYDANLLGKTQAVLGLLAQEDALGHTTEVRPAGIEINGEQKEMRLIHIGRAALFALGLEDEAYRWDSKTASFVRLEDSRGVNLALQMAEGKHIMDLVELPLQHSR